MIFFLSSPLGMVNGKLLIVNDKLIEYLIIKPLDEALVQVIYFYFLSNRM